MVGIAYVFNRGRNVYNLNLLLGILPGLLCYPSRVMNSLILFMSVTWLLSQNGWSAARSIVLQRRLVAACYRASLALNTFSQTVIELELIGGETESRYLVTSNSVMTLPAGLVVILPRQ